MRTTKINHYKVPLNDGLRLTLIAMRELERIALNEPLFVRWVKNHFASSCGICQLKNIWKYVHENFKYVEDKFDEVLISPAIIIDKRFGDCDDFSLFIHTCLSALNVPSKYVLLGVDQNKPTHIVVHALGNIIDGTNSKFNDIPKKYKYYNFV